MSSDIKKQTTFGSVVTSILRHYRMEQGFSRAKFSDWLGLSPSTWGKIENGEIQLSINIISRFKEQHWLIDNTWYIIAVAEYYESLLKEHNWEIVNQLEGTDDLLTDVNNYYYQFDVYGNRKDKTTSLLDGKYTDILQTGVMNQKISPLFKKILNIP